MLSSNATISLLAPTRGRPDQAMRLALSVLQTASRPEQVELLFYVDSNDLEKANYEKAIEQHKSQLDRFRRCLLVVAEPIGISKAWNVLAALSQGDLLIMAADDQTYNTAGWDDRLLIETQRFEDEIFCIWFNDGHWGKKLCTFPIVSRKWCLTLGYFTTGLFECLYDDLWIMDLAQRLDRLHYIPDVLTEHLHWSYGKSDIDATYAWKQVNDAGQLKPTVRRDMNLFSRTAPYREADAQRLMQSMKHPPQALKSGLALMGQTSIFADGAIAQSVSIEKIAQPKPASELPVVVNLCLPPSNKSFKLQLRPQIPQQQMMLAAFQQGQYYQPHVSQLLMQVLQPGDCFIDADAEIGYLAMLAAAIVGDRGKVIAIEPDPNSYAQLLETLRLNGFAQVQAAQASVDVALLDRLLKTNLMPKLVKLRLNQAIALLRQNQSIPYLLCRVESEFHSQDFSQNLAAIGYRGLAIGEAGISPLVDARSLKESYLLLMQASQVQQFP